MRETIWQGDLLVKEIQYRRLPPMYAEVTPLIVLQDGPVLCGLPRKHMGLVLRGQPRELLPTGNNEESKEQTPLTPFELDLTSALLDPIRWWRAAQLLAALPQVNLRCEFDLFIAAGRPEPDDYPDQRVIREVRSALPERLYEEIMARPVPTDLLTWIVKHVDEGNNGDLDEALWHLTKEIEAGSVRWSQKLRRIGVEHPDHRRAVNEARRQLALRYGPALCSYAAFQRYPYDPQNDWKKTGIMELVVSTLYESIERGIERDYGSSITMLVAVLVAEMELDQMMEQCAEEHPDYDCYQHPLWFHLSREERFAQMQRWRAALGRGTPNPGIWENALPLLNRLCNEWKKMPIVCPLVY